jgi:hypothetical protein
MRDIELHSSEDAWKDFPALKALLRDRIDWDTGKPMISIEVEACVSPNDDERKKKLNCQIAEQIKLGPKQVEDASIFDTFSHHWQEADMHLMVTLLQTQAF